MIKTEDLCKNYGNFRAVDNLCLNIPAGELFCFLGPNGAGKTTTIKMLCGLLKPSSGSITIGGIDISRDPVAIRRFSGYIPDTPFLYDRLTASEFFDFTGDMYNIPRAVVEKEKGYYFDLFGLSEHAGTLVGDFSHGMRQRLVYSVTFMHNPRVLFVDEPFVGLDPYSIRLIHDMLREKARAGVTILLTTHILAFAENLAHRIGIISNGKLVATGTLPELTAQSRNRGGLEEVFLSLTGSVNGAGKSDEVEIK